MAFDDGSDLKGIVFTVEKHGNRWNCWLSQVWRRKNRSLAWPKLWRRVASEGLMLKSGRAVKLTSRQG
ncbi:hypothetical protein [Pseudomonas massiliensis]|uniref:hypothetical protein n=1 Tax=Pseudomonas massiliensis TaxID=522492 RepID=UPI0011DD6723|nr:hypothetical protein [Pseudomonas massiliensis]